MDCIFCGEIKDQSSEEHIASKDHKCKAAKWREKRYGTRKDRDGDR